MAAAVVRSPRRAGCDARGQGRDAAVDQHAAGLVGKDEGLGRILASAAQGQRQAERDAASIDARNFARGGRPGE
jgi:hypothetical protein